MTRVCLLVYFCILREITAIVSNFIKYFILVWALGTLCHLIIAIKLKCFFVISVVGIMVLRNIRVK